MTIVQQAADSGRQGHWFRARDIALDGYQALTGKSGPASLDHVLVRGLGHDARSVVNEQLNRLCRYGADPVFPPGESCLPWALPLSVANATPEGWRQ